MLRATFTPSKQPALIAQVILLLIIYFGSAWFFYEALNQTRQYAPPNPASLSKLAIALSLSTFSLLLAFFVDSSLCPVKFDFSPGMWCFTWKN